VVVRARWVGLLLGLLVLTGCATVPGSSDVTVLRRVGDAAEPSAPPGPARGAGPLETVRGWVQASGSTAERHEVARRFLTAPAAGGWDDGAAPVVVSDRVDTVYADRPVPTGVSAVRIRATRLGTLSPTGAFLPESGALDLVVELVVQNGQWRISSLPAGTVVRRSDLRANTRPVRAWFVGATSGLPVSETRYLQVSPIRSLAARTLDLLTSGPSASLAGAVTGALPPRATLRATDALDPSGALGVDIADAGSLDDVGRNRIARQVVLTLAGIGVPRVRLTADGAPLVPGRSELGVGDVLAGLPARVLENRDLPLDPAGAGSPAAPDPRAALVVSGGRVSRAGDPATEVVPDAGPATAQSASESSGDEVAVVAVDPSGSRLLVGPTGASPTPVPLAARTLTRPTWSPIAPEVWTVADGTRVVRVVRAAAGTLLPLDVDAGGLAGAGGISAMRLSPDGARVAAVAGGRVLVGVVVREPAGGVRVTSVQALRPGPTPDAVGTPGSVTTTDALVGVLDAAWARSDRLVAVGGRTGHPVSLVSVDGLDLDDAPTLNLTPPVTAVAATPGRPVLAVDQGGLWSLLDDGSGVWRFVNGGAAGSVPAYPG